MRHEARGKGVEGGLQARADSGSRSRRSSGTTRACKTGDERNKVWVFLQDLDRMSSLSQIVYRHHCVSFETWNVGLEVTLNDRVELVVVCIYVAWREVLDHHAQKQHGELFVIDRLCLAVREHELEQFVPLFVWYQDHCERADHISDVLLHDRSRLCNKALQ